MNDNNNNDQTSITGHGRTSHSRGISRSRRQREYSQFHINQFYEAAEDEQLYTDEYLIFARDYNRFVTNSNIMFSRIEQGLRSNIARSITREYFYYNRHNELTRNTVLPGSSNYNDAANAAPAPAPTAATAATTASAATAAERHVPDNNMFSRVILDYMNNVLNLQTRDDLSYNPMPREPAPQREQQLEPPIHPRPNRTAQSTRTQPYAVFFDLTSDSTNHNNDNHNNNVLNRIFSDRNTNIPTAREIQVGTANTRFSNILAPTNSICPISHDEFIDTSEVTQIRGCSHIFNRTSLSEWFRTHSTCPMCRYDIRDYREISEPLHRMRTQASANANANTTPTSNSASQRPDLGAIQSIVGNGNNINDIYHRIMDNSSNFTNAIIENMNENMITFSYDLPSFYRGGDGDGDSDIEEVD